MNKKLIFVIALIIALFSIGAVSAGLFDFLGFGDDTTADVNVVEDGEYCTVDEVAAYIKEYHKLPSNYITKKEARAMGWEGGSLEPYAPGYCIGGDRFGNYEGLLPKNEDYRECDINTLGADKRGSERLIFAGEDGDITLIYYTGDHYQSFQKIYEEK